LRGREHPLVNPFFRTFKSLFGVRRPKIEDEFEFKFEFERLIEKRGEFRIGVVLSVWGQNLAKKQDSQG
jgi:hypothetical protein